MGTATALQVKTTLMKLLIFPVWTFVVLINRGVAILDSIHVKGGALRVPTFYAPNTDKLMVRRLASIVAILFGGIHCAGWNFPFPSHAELIIWRVSSLIILIVPCIGVLADVIDDTDVIICHTFVNDTIGTVLLFGFLLSTPIYGLARLTLFVEAFIALRHLPPGAYAVVQWTALLLHI